MDKRRVRFATNMNHFQKGQIHPYMKRVYKNQTFTKAETEISSRQFHHSVWRKTEQHHLPYRPDTGVIRGPQYPGSGDKKRVKDIQLKKPEFKGHNFDLKTHVLEMIVMDLQTPSLVKEKGFHSFISALHPSIDAALSASAIRNELVKVYDFTKKRVKKAVINAKDPVLSAEVWISNKVESYLTVKCHFIDEKWEMKSYTLDTAQLLGEDTAENIHIQLLRISAEWEIREKIQVVIVNLGMKKVNQNSNWTYIPCFSHTLNKVIQEVFTNPDWRYLPKKCRRIVQFFHHEHEASWGHRLAQSDCLDWLSTLNMVKKIWEQWPSISQVSNYSPTSNLWLNEKERKLLENMVKVLTVVKDVIWTIGTCGYVSVSNIIPIIDKLQSSLRGLIRQDNKVALRISDICNHHFGSIRQNAWFTLSTALDPRFKSSILIDDEGEKVQTKIKDEMSKHPSGATSSEDLVLQYALEEGEENPLQYWAAKKKSKNLAMVAHKYLSVISTVIPVEQMKDQSQIISNRRKCLELDDINMMLFLNGNYKKI
ncbi:E3 SUMO-protein ligase ZBED1 isoform X2 [Silurus meridionalis]|uniref:E3 SUMO-protein ligase ZBED1 isoform X2 n=1 Tax=Silurus meridionalis TaxID=175797 RepID=UPI001EEB2E9C|nr:E3 SUMO-protein ligase ZBED1 isoform X2 [Silurus meridionalis]